MKVVSLFLLLLLFASTALVNIHGLFGRNSGMIRNLGIIDSYVSGDRDIGGLAGINMDNGVIDNCYFSGTVGNGSGLVGANSGIIINSYSTGKVISSHKESAGGLVGFNNKGSIINSYSIGTVKGIENVGGFVGGINVKINAYVTNAYYDKQTSGQIDSDEGEGKTTAEMKQKSTYIGWDFDKTWGIDSAVNGGYPYLLKAK